MAMLVKHSMTRKYGDKSGQFSASIREWGDEAVKRSSEVVKKTIFDIFARIVARTPVDIGYLKANWQVGINAQPSLQIDSADPSGTATIQAGFSVISGSKGWGDAYYITNNLPYAIPIEYGHSKVKAPAGMVRVTLVEFKDVFYGNYKTL